MPASSGTAPFSGPHLGQKDLQAVSIQARPKVVFLVCDAGGGHRSAAQALTDALHQSHPDRYETEIADIDELLGPVGKVISEAYCQSYNLALRHGQYWLEPWIFNSLTASRKLLEPLGIRYMQNFLASRQPDLLVTLIHGSHDAMVPALQTYREIPYLTVVTDAVTIRKSWVDKACHEIIVSTQEAQAACLEWGISAQNLRLIGHPVNPRFAQDVIDLPALRQRYQLDADRFTIMMMMGGTGGRNIYRFSKCLEQAGLPVQILACCGSDRRLQHKMERFAQTSTIPTRVFAYTHEIPELMSLSNLIVTKPGPGTIMEALARDLPLIIDDTHYTMYQEKGNLDFVRKYNLGRVIHQVSELLPIVQSLLDNPEDYAILKDAVIRHKRPRASLDIAERIHQHMLQSHSQ